VQALAFRVLINNGVATAKPLTLSLIGSGTIAGELSIDAQTDLPRVRAALKGSNIELGMFFRNSRYFDTTKGKIQGQVALAGSGKSLAQVMSVADGNVGVAMTGGSVSALMVSLAGLQLFDALILYVTGDNCIPILCALGRLTSSTARSSSTARCSIRRNRSSTSAARSRCRARSSMPRSRPIRSRSIFWTCTARLSSRARSVRPRYRSAESYPSRPP
jgi:hypothetical protein